jgi:AraC-like DNA-binding protein
VDVVTDILDSMRLSGGVVVDGATRGDWCLLSEFNEDDRDRMAPGATAMVAYHYIRSGRVQARVEGSPAITARAGDIILLPRNDAHLLYSRGDLPPIDSHELMQEGSADGEPARLVIDGPGEPASFYCGFLAISAERHPLFDSLPAILKLRSSDAARTEWLESSLRFMNEEVNAPEIVARLAELFLAEAIRRYVEQLPAGEGGWLAGLRDPAVARALSIIHNRYAEELDIETLARESGVSRTVLGERFGNLIGEPPMRYCARWRMRVAANMLRDGKQNAANVAYAVGFNSEAAFTRAFKRE